MKDLSPRWAALALLTPVFLILALILLGDLNRARAAKVKAAQSTVVVGFTGSVVQVNANDQPILNPPPLPFQHVYLNIVSVRLNPSTSSVATDGEGGWQTIPVPAGVGNSTTSGFFETGLNFGGNFGSSNNSVGLAEGRSELQVDMTQLSQLPLFFNASQIKANTYNQVELVLDSSTFPIAVNGVTATGSNAGNVVPLCASTQPAGEGCIIYPVTIFNPSATISVTKSPINLSSKGLFPLVVNIQADIQSVPPQAGGPILIQPHISIVQNNGLSQNGLPLNQELATISGTITNLADNSGTIVTAEDAGTNIVVEQYNVQSVGTTANPAGSYALFLPAASAGTSYDIYVSGPDRAFAVKSGLTVFPSTGRILDFDTPTQKKVALAGSIEDECTVNPIVPVQAATLQLLVPDTTISPLPDCTAGPAPGCVSVATASTDEAGNYPLPGNGKNLPAFSNIPTSDTAGPLYTMLITASGYDRTLEEVDAANNNNLTCPGGLGNGNCNFNLSHGYLDGTLGLATATSGPLSAMVVAEDAGTGNIENFAQALVARSQSSTNFSMLVPDDVSGFDLFATVQDDFEGQAQLQSMHVPQANTGHSIPVEADVAAPAACATVTASELGGVTCVGHGSLEGSLNNPTAGTEVVLEKDNVQVITSVVGPFGSDDSGGYAICAPPDNYTLQRFDNGVAGESEPVALNDPVIVPTPAPSASFVPTPCPGICDAGQGNECLVCTETAGPSL